MRTLPTIGVLVLVGAVAWIPLRMLLFGGRASYTNTPQGEWVGTMTLDGVYHADRPWEKGGPQRMAAIKFKLSVADTFMDEYAGWGEIWVTGDPTPIKLRVVRVSVHPNGYIRPAFLAEPLMTADIDGSFTPTEIDLHQEDNWAQKFTSTLHRGTDADYQRIAQQLRGAQPSH